MATSDEDLIKGWRLSATLQVRTPLRVLARHGEFWDAKDGPPPKLRPHEGGWLHVLRTYAELGIPIPEVVVEGKTMASDIGQVPVDGGEYLRFLKCVRQVVEENASISARLDLLRRELARTEWRAIVDRHGGAESICRRFFPAFIETIPRLPAESLDAMVGNGWMTPAKLSAVPEAELKALKGIGPAAIKRIRLACQMAVDKDSEFVENVER